MGITQVQTCYNDGVNGESCFSPVTLTQADGGGGSLVEGAKSFSDTSPLNYYEIDQTTNSPQQYGGLLPATSQSDGYTEMTLVFCINPTTHNVAEIISTSDRSFTVYMASNFGGIVVRMIDASGGWCIWYVNASDSPQLSGQLEEGEWSAVMISMQNDAGSPESTSMKIMIDGAIKQDGPAETGGNNPTMRPMGYGGRVSVGRPYNTEDQLDCGLSYIWCDETYLDPETYFTDFFSDNGDGTYTPKYIGENGENVTGSQPATYAPDADLTNNLGTMENWTEFGTVPDAPTKPTD